MPKLKTKSGVKKRFRLTAKGKVIMPQAKKRHNLRKRSQEMKRNARGTSIMKDCDAKIITKFFIPYGLA
jgi:large subunit ribosomal protein L35